MRDLIIGFDLCDDYTQVAWKREGMEEPESVVFGQGDHPAQISTSVCRLRGEDRWEIGEDAARTALFGAGTIVDKLLRMLAQDGTATFEGVRYSAEDLMTAFLKTVLEKSTEYIDSFEEQEGEPFSAEDIRMLVFSLQDPELDRMDALMRCVRRMGIPDERVRIISHAESFAFFTAGKHLDIWANDVGLFDLTKGGLYFYRFSCTRGVRPNVISVATQVLEESFSLDLLDNESGRKLADSILAPCAERMMAKRVYSAVFLSGEGFAECEGWADRFLAVLCKKRRVFMTENIFAKGAACEAEDLCLPATRYPYLFSLEGRVKASVSVPVMSRGVRKDLTLVPAGRNWYDAKAETELLVNGEDPLDLVITSSDAKETEHVISISLADFPVREGYTTRVLLSVCFLSEDRLAVTVRDEGFGEIFPSSGLSVTREVSLNQIKS